MHQHFIRNFSKASSMSKLLYICLTGSFKVPFSGVEKKIVTKLKCFAEQSEKLVVVFPWKNSFKENTDINCEVVYIFDKKPKSHRFLNETLQNYLLYKELGNKIAPYLDSGYNAVCRYPMSSIGLLRLVKKFPEKITFEHNTKELEETTLNVNREKKTLKFSLRPSLFFQYAEKVFLPVFIEKRNGHKVLKYAKSGVCVTHELAEYEKSRCSGYRTRAISNGINVGEHTPVAYKPIGDSINVIMLNGFEAARGLERCIIGLKEYKGKENFQFHIFGKNTAYEIELMKKNNLEDHIHFHDLVNKEQLDQVINDFHFGLSGLAAYKKGMTEGCSLKVREYLSRGLPVILAQKDTDLSFNPEAKNLYMELPCNEMPLDFEYIASRAREIYADVSVNSKVRAFAEKEIQYSEKIAQIIEFVNSDD
jgi:glycosyltransferase involved in cell wall biosynthesis